nr:nodulation protein [Melilotus officinalis]
MPGRRAYAYAQYAGLIATYAARTLLEEVDGNNYVSDLVGKIYTKVDRQKKKLISNRNLVRVKVEATDHKTEKVSDAVFEWLKETDMIIQEMENLIIQSNPPSWNEFKKVLEKLKALNGKYDFHPFSTKIPSLEYFSLCNNFECFKSTDKASNELLEALKDGNCSIIGLYGKQDSGKTTLVQAMGEKVKYLHIFCKVLIVTVTQNPNIRTIQDEIADSLNIIFDKNTEAGRAKMLSSAIENMDHPILVIFDDVRAKFELGNVGIPCNSNRCKVLLTARCQQDYDLMHCQREIQLDPLSIEEAWTLFKKHSGIHDEEKIMKDVLDVACQVVSDCEGLPEKIIKMGSSLRSKPILEWKASLETWRYSLAKWHIFLSFRGKDTRQSFTGFLYDALCRKGFKTFMDDEELKGGEEISSSLVKAIEASRIAIVVFSENFADSPWCLDELVTILKCKKMKNQKVLPIFYKIEPSVVRHQTNSYKKAMAKHKKKYRNDSEKVKEWMSALSEIANLKGIASNCSYEYKLIEEIVEMANDAKKSLCIQSIDTD